MRREVDVGMLLDFELAGEPVGKTKLRYVDIFRLNVLHNVSDRSHGGRKAACVSKMGVAH